MYLVDHNQQVSLLQTLALDLLLQQILVGIKMLKVYHSQVWKSSNTYTLSGGVNYQGGTSLTASGALTATLGEISTGYELFENTENFEIDFILMGSGSGTKSSVQAKANKIIQVAEARKDAVAFISPNRGTFINDGTVGTVTVNSDSQITNEVVSFYAPITSTTFAVFDSGYKYMYDRFSDTFRYVPLKRRHRWNLCKK